MVGNEIGFQLRSTDASWTHDMWERLPNGGNRYEIIGGVLYRTTVSDGCNQPSHGLLIEHVALPFEEHGLGFGTMSPAGVVMSATDVVQPDFLLIRAERHDVSGNNGRIWGVPDLIAEVLSVSHADYDVFTKRAAYARAGVPEYWILRPETRDILAYTQPDTTHADFTYVQRFDTDSELVSPTLPIQVPVAALFEDAL